MKETNKWFALYTKPRFEKKASEDLHALGIENYLPTYKTIRQWSDRKKMVELPLFPSYCFVSIQPSKYLEPLKANGVIKFVWFNNKPVPIPDKEIEAIKILCGSQLPLELSSIDFAPGQKVIVSQGVLSGIEGEYVKNSGKKKILVRINSINHGVIVSINPEYVVGL
jgi:transcriptional antiterminator RfaH